MAWEKNWAQAVPVLQAFHKQVGSGILSRFPAFIWQQESTESGQLVGIPHPDPIQLKQLIGLDQEHQIIVDNTKRFLNNLPAHNVILYGDRGSGKSSTVKSLLHAYAPQGLRMVELPNTALSELPNLMRYLAQQKQHFIIFIDDLSFETSESQYKWLKAALEGGLSPKPRNVLVYVTSNRHHLIKETFSERREDEVHPGDSIQEKLSLADRFGLTIVFSNPDQQGYLQIVEHMAHQHHINIPPQELRRMALEWALWHNGHSGRTAKQFIDHLLDAVLD